jgi:hypothetical protein
MRSRICPAVILFFSLTLTGFSGVGLGQEQGLVAKWSFDEAATPVTHESVGGIDDKVGGFYKYVPGVAGTGLRLDGYTTLVRRAARQAPRLSDAFTVEAWVALNTLPWNWVPIVDHERFQQVGYSFGIDAFGHVGLQVSVEGVWQSLYSTARLPLKQWAHVAGTFDAAHGLTLYIDGKEAGRLPVQGKMKAAEEVDLIIGRPRQAMLPVPGEAIHPFNPVWYSLDGILDEIKIYSRCLGGEEVEERFADARAPAGQVLPWAVLPAGPPGAGRFGGYYATLKFEDVWDRPRRIGPDSDVVVRFDQSPMRLVFWQGTNYIPAWVTENGKWYTDEFMETWGHNVCPEGSDCEPMSDKQSHYSHVDILESNDARVVLHWRYALSEVMHDLGAHTDPLTGWFDWGDEYFTVYPDGVAVRKQVLHTSSNPDSPDFEWQETIVINGPGQKPEDNINPDALTMANLKGETATYTWKPRPEGNYGLPDGPRKLTGPEDANIQIVNLKSTWKPFQIVPPAHARMEVFNETESYFMFVCWNHWPVAQIASSGRPCLAPDRPSHTTLSHIYWDPYQRSESGATKLRLDGLTTKSITELMPLAKSWLSPPQVEVATEGFRSEGYNPAERAFIVVHEASAQPAALDVTIQATEASPAVNPALLIKNWGDAEARLTVNGKLLTSENCRMAHVQRLEGTDLVVWIVAQDTHPLHIRLAPKGEK